MYHSRHTAVKSAYLLRFASGARRRTVGCWAKMSPVDKPADVDQLLTLNIGGATKPAIWMQSLSQEGSGAEHPGGDCTRLSASSFKHEVSGRAVTGLEGSAASPLRRSRWLLRCRRPLESSGSGSGELHRRCPARRPHFRRHASRSCPCLPPGTLHRSAPTSRRQEAQIRRSSKTRRSGAAADRPPSCASPARNSPRSARHRSAGFHRNRLASDEALVGSKSLKLFRTSFRKHGALHDECTVLVGRRIAGAIKPLWLRVCGYRHPRGGIAIDVFWQTGAPPEGAWLPDTGVAPYRWRRLSNQKSDSRSLVAQELQFRNYDSSRMMSC